MEKRIKKKTKRRKEINKIPILIILGIIILTVGFIIWRNNTLSGALNQSGYATPELDSPFYKKRYSTKTLDGYLQDVKNGINSEYEEYNYTKNSSSLVGVKMTFRNGENKSFNITSDLLNGKVSFSVDYSFKDQKVLLEGSSVDNYVCHTVYKENTNRSLRESLCSEVHNEVSIFINRQNELLQNNVIVRNIDNSVE